MGGLWGYQQFFSVALTNRHSVCECTWLEEVHHFWKGIVSIFAWESEPQVAHCTWSRHLEMCWYLRWAPLTVQNWASPYQQEERLCHFSLLQTVQNYVLDFLHAAVGFPCAAHHAAGAQLVGRKVCLVLCVCLCHGLALVACLIPTCSASPLADHPFSSAHPAPVRYLEWRQLKTDSQEAFFYGTAISAVFLCIYLYNKIPDARAAAEESNTPNKKLNIPVWMLNSRLHFYVSTCHHELVWHVTNYRITPLQTFDQPLTFKQYC